MGHGHRIVRWGRLDGYWEPNNPMGLGIGCAREWLRTCTGYGNRRDGFMMEMEGENGNQHLMQNSCTLLNDYIEWT